MRIATSLCLTIVLLGCGGSGDDSFPDVDTDAITEAFESSHLPIVLLDTGGTPIPDEPKLPARMIVIDTGDTNTLETLPRHYDGHIGIELRGHSSMRFPKKQFAVETRDEQDDDLDVALLGFPEEEDWVFYAPYSDKTLIRNSLAYRLASEFGRYAPRTRQVELFLDGTYWGIYLVTEKMKRDRDRIDIAKLDESDSTEPAISGGYLLELTDTVTPSDTVVTTERGLFELKEPKPNKVTPAQFDWIQAYLRAFETALYGPDFTDPTTGWRAFADESSFVDYVLMQELSNNTDAFKRSTFLTKDREGLLHAGPVWDFNLAFGNVPNDELGYLPRGFRLRSDESWAGRLLRDRSFADAVIARWREMREGPFSDDWVLSLVDTGTAMLGDAAVRNFERWPVIGRYVWPNPTPIPQSYDEEVATLRRWIATRLQWMDDTIHFISDARSSP